MKSHDLMKRRYCRCLVRTANLLAVAFWGGAMAGVLTAQKQPLDVEAVTDATSVLRIGIQGALELEPDNALLAKHHFASFDFRFCPEELQFLSDPVVADDLELSSQQRSAIGMLAADSLKARDEWRQRWTASDQGLGRTMADECRALEAAYRGRLEAALLPHQLELLDLVVTRHLMALLGAERWYSHPRVLQTLALTSAESEAISAVAADLLTQFRRESRQLAKKLDSCWVALLDESQVARYGDLFGNHGGFDGACEQYELVLFRSESLSGEKEAFRPENGDNALWRTAMAGRMYQLDGMGRLKEHYSMPGFPVERFAEAVLSPPLSERIGVPPPVQPLLLKEWRRERTAILAKFANKLAEMKVQSMQHPGQLAQLLVARDELAAETSKQIWDNALTRLPPDSQQLLEAESCRCAIVQLGLLRASQSPELEKYLGLSGKQQNELKASTAREFDSIRESGWDMEARIMEAMSKVLDVDSRDRMRRVLDARSSEFHPVPMLLLQQSRGNAPATFQPDQANHNGR